MRKRIEKIIYILINILAFGGLSLFIFFNHPRIIDITSPLNLQTHIIKLIYISLFSFVSAYIAGITACLLIKSKTDDLCNAYQKRHESISIENDNSNAKIAALEAKIKTLEAALESALKKD